MVFITAVPIIQTTLSQHLVHIVLFCLLGRQQCLHERGLLAVPSISRAPDLSR